MTHEIFLNIFHADVYIGEISYIIKLDPFVLGDFISPRKAEKEGRRMA